MQHLELMNLWGLKGWGPHTAPALPCTYSLSRRLGLSRFHTRPTLSGHPIIFSRPHPTVSDVGVSTCASTVAIFLSEIPTLLHGAKAHLLPMTTSTLALLQLSLHFPVWPPWPLVFQVSAALPHPSHPAAFSTTWEILILYRVWLLSPSEPHPLRADPEEIFPGRFHLSDAGLLSITEQQALQPLGSETYQPPT